MRVMRNSYNDFREYLLRPLYQVNMAVGNRIKAPGVNRSLAHNSVLINKDLG